MAGKAGGEVYVGVDSGTQSTKVLLVDGDSGRILGAGTAPHALIDGLPPGHVEQHPADWWSAFERAFAQALAAAGVAATAIRGIGVSGQQHGLVPLDRAGEVIRPAKLWCDTSTTEECARLVEAVGGAGKFLERTGNGLPPGFTASKILWLKEHEPAHYARLATVLLPHDYLNFRLTGRAAMEPGDASGTALFDVRRRAWAPEVIAAIDPALSERLPPLIASDAPCGVVRSDWAQRWGLGRDVLVSAGGGDNMMSAIGTGNVTAGVVTVSLGTSGTIFAYAATPVVDPAGEAAAFCDSTGAWLPLVCTMNVTVATELTKTLLALDAAAFERAVCATPPGSEGLMLIPYFEGERTPNVPEGAAVWFGATRQNHTPAHFARAAMEGATLGLDYGLQRLRSLGICPREIRLTGGGSNSPAWRQICADVFGVPVVCLAQAESAALGAALQACWCRNRQRGNALPLADLAARWLHVVEATWAAPEPVGGERYRALGGLHARVAATLRGCFAEHRRIAQTWISR